MVHIVKPKWNVDREAAMVAAELSRTRADHRQRMEAKARTKVSTLLQRSNYQQETAPVRVYGSYTPPGRGHPSGPAVDMSELEDHIIMNVAGVYIALHPGCIHAVQYVLCSMQFVKLFRRRRKCEHTQQKRILFERGGTVKCFNVKCFNAVQVALFNHCL